MANFKQSLDQLLRLREMPGRQARRFWLWINRITRNYALYFAQALKNFATKGQQEAAGFAYWAMFSMFPFFVLLLIIATSNQGHWSGRAQILSIADQMLPQVGSSVIQDALDNLPPNQHAFSLISALGLIFGSIRLFTNIQKSMSRIFRDERGRPWLVQTLIGLIMMITFGVLMTVSTSLAALIALLRKQPTFVRTPAFGLEAVLALLIINVALFTMLYRFVPRRKVSWRSVLLGALLGAILWEVGRGVFDWYIDSVANLGATYGSVAAVMGLLLWMFFVGCLISLCAEIAVATADWQASRAPSVAVDVPEPNRPADELTPTLRREFAVEEPRELPEPQESQESIQPSAPEEQLED